MTDRDFILKLREAVDYVDGALVWKHTYGRRQKGRRIGTPHNQGYREATFDGHRYLLHTLIFAYHHGYFPKMIDHIDGDRLNNRIENLRECSYKENGYNSKKRIDNTSGHKGVSWSKSTNKWTVRIKINNTYKYFGVYEDFELACFVADEARNKYHKEFANNGACFDKRKKEISI